jgi:endothelin-converting enzyme/putative endopeptidase
VNATDAVNYGAIGVVIGHEISHGFDDQGAQFDAQGRLANWWTDADNKQFAAAACAWSTSSRATSSSRASTTTASWCWANRSATSAGAKLAYRAYQKSREGKGPEPTIDGFTPEQQFFIAWGQWRGDETRMENAAHDGPGRPAPGGEVYRVNGPLSKPAGIPEGVPVQARRPDGAARGGPAAKSGDDLCWRPLPIQRQLSGRASK